MSEQTFVISPEIAAGSGGLADYTLRVLEHWPGGDGVQVIVPRGRGGEGASTPMQEVEANAKALLALLPRAGGKVLLQYSAYGFDRLGYPRWLLRALIDWKKRASGRLVVMFHEIWTFWPVLNRNYPVQMLHRRDIGALLEHIDAAFTSTMSQVEHLRALSPTAPVQVLPVGSNIRASAVAPPERANAVAVLFGSAETRLRTLESMREDLKSLSRAGAIAKISSVGVGDSPDQLERERTLLAGFALREGFDQCGALPEAAVSQIMSAAAFGISAQDELSTTKSGTLMAYAAHGMNIISRYAGAAKAEPLCWFTAPAELLAGIAPAELSRRAANLRAWQEETASWRVIAGRLADALQVRSGLS